MISGLSPVTPLATMRANGVMPSSRALVSLMTITAAAPSLSGQALPAVTVPPSRNTGLRPASPSRVVPGRGPSSLVTTSPLGVVTGMISRSKKPASWAATARVWDWSGELVLLLAADLLVLGHVLRRLAHGDVHVGQAGQRRPGRTGCRGALDGAGLGLGEQRVVGTGVGGTVARSG